MKKFIQKVVLFIVPFVLIVMVAALLPTTPRASGSLLMSSIKKDSLLRNTPSPRIIFVGGSNLSFGLNSQTIKDSLQFNPINTAIHASIGIKFMMTNTLEYVQKGDIVVLVPEYEHFYRSLDFGSEELMRTIFDLDIKHLKHININQFINLMPFLPKYSLTKFNINEYRDIKESDIYSVNSFNKYGDTYTHWVKQQEEFAPFKNEHREFNYEVIRYFEEYNSAIQKNGALLLVSFPCFQETSFRNSVNQILKVEQEFEKSKLKIIGSAERYKMADSLMFNTPYHLNKNGVDYRTMMIIEDIKKARTLVVYK